MPELVGCKLNPPCQITRLDTANLPVLIHSLKLNPTSVGSTLWQGRSNQRLIFEPKHTCFEDLRDMLRVGEGDKGVETARRKVEIRIVEWTRRDQRIKDVVDVLWSALVVRTGIYSCSIYLYQLISIIESRLSKINIGIRGGGGGV